MPESLPQAFALALLLGACAPSASRPASTPEPLTMRASASEVERDLDDVIRYCDLIVLGDIVSVYPARWSSSDGRLPPGAMPWGMVIFGDSEILVDRTLKGVLEHPVVRVRTFGGQVGADTMEVSGEPRLERGRTYPLFLVEDRGSTAEIGPQHYLNLAPLKHFYTIEDGKAVSTQESWDLEALIQYVVDRT